MRAGPTGRERGMERDDAMRSGGDAGRARAGVAGGGGAILFALLALHITFVPASAFQDAEVRAIVGHVVDASAHPGHGGVRMARQPHQEIDGSGKGRMTEHLIARVFDPGWGAEQFGPWRRTWAAEQGTKLRVIRARVWSSRTEFVDLPVDAVRETNASVAGGCENALFLRETTATFPPLKPGEVVELLLRTDAPIPPYEKNARWIEETLGAEETVIEQQFQVTLPAAAQVDTAVVGNPLRPAVRHFEGYRRFTWLTGNLPAAGVPYAETPWSRYLDPPDSVGPVFPRVCFGTLRDWVWAGRNYGAGGEAQWKRSGDAAELAAEIVRRSDDPEARALAVEALVQDSIATIPSVGIDLLPRPLAAAETAHLRCGTPREKACLLIALLRAAGIEASPVLVRSRPGRLVAEAPGLTQFDRWLARARIRGEERWFDPLESDSALPAGQALLMPGLSDPTDLQLESGLVAFPGRAGRVE